MRSFLLLALAIGRARAGEGMWTPEQVASGQVAEAAQRVKLPAAQLGSMTEGPLAAVVSLGGCTASFVSPDGLLATNHHCVEGYLNQAGRGERDLIAEGFFAPTQADEASAGPTARVWVLESAEDVTARLQPLLKDPSLADAERSAAVDRAKSALVARCERGGDRRCRVAAYDRGARYVLLQNRELRDLRLVYAPPFAVGMFGGDTDNFRWPRHDADFAFLRAYVAPDGRSADYASDNVPYRPPRWLEVNAAGAAPGATAWVAGYPGGTDRWALPEYLAFEANLANPRQLADLEELLALVEAEAARSPEARAHLQARILGLQNRRTYLEGLRDNLAASPILEARQEEGRRIDAWIAADPSRAPMGADLARVRELIAEDAADFPRDRALGALTQTALFGVAHGAYRWSLEREVRKDLDREPGFQDRDREHWLGRMKSMEASLWLPAERALTARALGLVQALPPEAAIAPVLAWLEAQGGPEAALDLLYRDPPLAQAQARLALFGSPRADLERSEDPWVQLAVRLERAELAARRERDDARTGELMRRMPSIHQAWTSAAGRLVYPDANSTLRLTFGQVVGYTPQDGLVALPQTTLSGLLAKHRLPAYEAPAWLLEAAERRAESRWFDPALGDVPVDFLSDVDTTGGNSGSPTLDADGRLIGLLFDGTYESMAADWLYDPATTRSVHVDLRYIAWVLEAQGATRVLTELGLAR
jgi:hypothetical protein